MEQAHVIVGECLNSPTKPTTLRLPEKQGPPVPLHSNRWYTLQLRSRKAQMVDCL